MRGTIFDIMKFALHDGDGIRTTVFFKGCPLDCWWCHNPESRSPQPQHIYRAARCIRCGSCIETCPEDALSRDDGRLIVDQQRCREHGLCARACPTDALEIAGQEMTVEEVMQLVRRDQVFYEESGGGVTFSGGEPALQADFLCALLDACRLEGIHTAVDTCGHIPWESLERIARRADLILYDLKIIDSAAHQRYTGVGNELILANLEHLSELRIDEALPLEVRIRVPVVPEVNDNDDNFERLGVFLAGLPGERLWVDLLPYQRLGESKYQALGLEYRLPAARPPDEERVRHFGEIVNSYGSPVTVRGVRHEP
jgi:pyruvate formate lyase activating enzyme